MSTSEVLLVVLSADLADGGRKAALAFGVALSSLSTDLLGMKPGELVSLESKAGFYEAVVKKP